MNVTVNRGRTASQRQSSNMIHRRQGVRRRLIRLDVTVTPRASSTIDWKIRRDRSHLKIMLHQRIIAKSVVRGITRRRRLIETLPIVHVRRSLNVGH